MILILGSSHAHTAEFYKTLDLFPSVLIESDTTEYQVGHTSPQDAGSFENLEKITARAHKVYVANIVNSEFASDIFYYEYLNWLKKFQLEYGTIENFPIFDFDPYKWNIHHKQQPKIPQLQKNDAVFIGCSFTEGVGLTKDSQRYSNIVSEYFNLNCINLAVRGSSNGYIFEVFSKLDFHDNQLVVLQLSSLERLRYCDKHGNLNHIMFGYPPTSFEMLEVYNNKFLFYETLIKLRIVNQFAKSKNLKLAVWLINYKEEDRSHYTKEQQMYFYDMKSFVPDFLMKNYLIDFGTDNLHPGPESNKNIADALVYFIKKTYSKI